MPRYRHAPVPALAEGTPEGTLKVIFDEPQRAVAPGQAVVLFDGTRESLKNWEEGARMTSDGLLEQGATSVHRSGIGSSVRLVGPSSNT